MSNARGPGTPLRQVEITKIAMEILYPSHGHQIPADAA